MGHEEEKRDEKKTDAKDCDSAILKPMQQTKSFN